MEELQPRVLAVSAATAVQKRPRKNRTKKITRDSPSDEDNPGCLALLKKISCSLQCGGTSCSIKETEPVSASSPSASSCESLTSIAMVEPIKVSPRKRRASSKPVVPIEGMTASEGVVPVKKARRTPKKSLPTTQVTAQV
jgi:hypothetical protein